MGSSTLIQDYTIRNGIGIRVIDRRTCQVIRKQRGVWREIGRKYELPLSEEDLRWTSTDIPASVIAVALRAYELDNPDSRLREHLTRRVATFRPLQPASTAAIVGG